MASPRRAVRRPARHRGHDDARVASSTTCSSRTRARALPGVPARATPSEPEVPPTSRACATSTRADAQPRTAAGWRDGPDAGAARSPTSLWLMDRGPQVAPALKALQGRIWAGGLRDRRAARRGLPDVPPALARWREQGRAVAIFSSGSVLAQKLLFATTRRRRPDAASSTATSTPPPGRRARPASYRRIAATLGVDPAAVCSSRTAGRSSRPPWPAVCGLRSASATARPP